MNFSRRSFIGNLGITAIGAASFGRIAAFAGSKTDDGLFQVPSSARTDFYLTSKHFEPLVGTVFEVETSGAASFRLRLTEVLELTNKQNELRGFYGESFSLLFEGGQGSRIEAGMHTFKHDVLGEVSFFVSPVDRNGTSYEVIVNRIRR